MKKVVYFLFALVLIGFSACDNEPKFKVQGNVTGAEDKTLYFEASGLNGIVVLDSTKLNSNGGFSFAEKCPESPEFYRLRLDGKIVNFAVDSTETVQIKADAGIDIGSTLIGMHLKRVAVPVRLEHNTIGEATVVAARTRPKFIGGVRAAYDEELL